MEEDQPQEFGENIDIDSGNNIENVLMKQQLQEQQLKILYNSKEKELKIQYEELRTLISQIWLIKAAEYREHVQLDPFLAAQLKNLEDEINEIDWTKIYQQSDENNETKQERELQLSKLRELWNAQSQFLMIMKGYTDLSSSYRSLMEELNTEIFKGQMEREVLETNQQQFSTKLKDLRSQIKNITEKNQRLMKEIENIKSSY